MLELTFFYFASLYLETPYTSLEYIRSINMSLESIILQLGMYNNILKQFISTTILLLSASLHQKNSLDNNNNADDDKYARIKVSQFLLLT